MPSADKGNTRKKQLRKKRVKAPRGDVGTGGGYDLKTPKKHKKTAKYRKAVREAQDTRTPAERRARTEKGTHGA